MNQTKPYVKKYVNGFLTNPITKTNPYLFAPHPGFLKLFKKPEEFKKRFWTIERNRFFKGLTIVRQ